MSSSLRDKLLSITPTLASEMVDVPEWDATIGVRSMTAGAQARLAGAEGGAALFKAIVECCFDPESGDQLFKHSDLEWLEQQDPKAIARVGEACMRVSGADEKAVDLGKGDS